MTLAILHVAEDVLAAYVKDDLDAAARERVSAHLRACARCQQRHRFLEALEVRIAGPVPAAPRDILARALAARAAGERRILPHPDVDDSAAHRPVGRKLGWAAALAASIALIAAAVMGRPHDVSASAAQSEMHITPQRPRVGDSIHVVYRPGAGLFAGQGVLTLRARLRTSEDEMYRGAVPESRVRAVATLRRSRDGVYAGSFLLPDSIVFVAIVVEDTLANHVDDNGGRNWEVLTHDAAGSPSYDALHQRINDLMGRSWEQGYATSKRLTELYPHRFDAWAMRAFFERALFGEARGDSVGRPHVATMDSLAAAAKLRPQLTASEIGSIYFDRVVRARSRKGATAADTADAAYWLNRLQHEHPGHMQLAQYYALRITPDEWKHPAAILDTLELVYPRFVPMHTPGGSLIQSAMRAVKLGRDDAAYRRWSERSAGLGGYGDSAYRLARALVKRPSLRREGEAALRRLLGSSSAMFVGMRSLEEDRRSYLQRAEDGRHVALAELGRALIADGHTRAGLDTLGLAANGSWDPALFENLLAAYAAAGDSTGMQAMRVRLAVDPRTPEDSIGAMTISGRARLGSARWDSLTNVAKGEMHARVLDRAFVHSLRGTPSLAGEDGRMRALRDLTGGRPAAVIFWSRDCGWAIEALPTIAQVAARMTREGKQVVFVVDERPSAELKQYLTSRHWSLPIYYDTRREMQDAFSKFGTPSYYVIDGSGRIRFDEVAEVADLLTQMEALAAEPITRRSPRSTDRS